MIKDFLEQFLFFPIKELKNTPNIYNIKYEDIYVNIKDIKCHGWFIESNKKNSISKDKVILFCHGNAGNISFRLPYIEKLYESGFSLLFFDYPGFGLSDGVPNEDNCILCGKEYYNFLTEKKKFTNNNIVFYGESIGGSIAVSLANICNIKYLILQSTFTDIKRIIQKIVNINFIFNNFGFETLEQLKIRNKLNIINKKMKTMVIHSNEDELIDIIHGNELSKYTDKYYICKGSHSSVLIDNDFIFQLLSFLKE
jgi:esterase/lipase